MKRFIFILISIVLFSSCSVYKEVEVLEIQNIEFIEFSNELVEIEVEILVDNPNNYKVKLLSADIDVSINKIGMGKLKLKEKLELPKNSTSVQKLKVLADSEKIQETLMANAISFLFSNSMAIEAKGMVKGKALGIGKKVDVEYKEKVSLDDIDLGF